MIDRLLNKLGLMREKTSGRMMQQMWCRVHRAEQKHEDMVAAHREACETVAAQEQQLEAYREANARLKRQREQIQNILDFGEEA